MHNFISYIFSLSERGDATSLSELRYGLREPTKTRSYKHICPFCSNPLDEFSSHTWGYTDDRFIAFQTVGGFYATHPVNDASKYANFGDVMKRLSNDFNTFETRFNRMLSCRTTNDICREIICVINAVTAKNVPVPWNNLLWDLLKWERTDAVKRSWASHFWNSAKEAEDEETTVCI